ncbi:MAG: hypothetical protein QOC82_1331 [Frankiaceae bacterium]|nr:hypothetical protein [Frankiaceae bacterium]
MTKRAGAALLVVLATACSGGSATPVATGPSPSPSNTVPGLISATAAVPADYLAGVDKICATSVASLRQRGPAPLAPTDPRQLTAKQLRGAAPYLQRGADIQQHTAVAIAGLAKPTAGADAWAVYVTAVGQYADGAGAEAAAAKAGDVPRFLAAAERLLRAQRAAQESGVTVGFGAGTACARLF